MKRKLFLFIACLSLFGTMLAQGNNRWQPVAGYSTPEVITGVVYIDGVHQASSDIEVAAFVGGEVRASCRLEPFNDQHPDIFIIQLIVMFNNSGESITFKAYNHSLATEYSNCTTTFNNEPISFTTVHSTYGTASNPVIFSFMSITLPITADKWYLIASPVGSVSPENVGNLVQEDHYALYSFDQNGDGNGKEWINYKNDNNGDFNLEPGQGYLYATDQENCTLTFTGVPNQYDIDHNELPLSYNPDADLPGYNLLGNPFNETVYIYEWPYYVMNEDGDAIIVGQGGIAPMQGFFVVADDENEFVNLSNEPTEKGASVALNVSQNRGNVIDRARVRFDESRQLPKFQLFENSTKVYIPQNGKDYAVVRSEGQGELPVNFHAAENGTYTLSIDAEDMEMNYLHLIDNMTGMDVDLLQTPSYTFEANVNDYESRFKLVFAGASTGSATEEAFAFFSNGNWIINNDGKATLQIVDVNGHFLCNEQINGCFSKSFEAAPGIYMLRLINGDNVKVQKIVVK